MSKGTMKVTRLAPGVSREIEVRECPYCGVGIEVPLRPPKSITTAKPTRAARRFEEHVQRCGEK